MARIYPFRALRYNPSIVSLQDVVTQPYDRITPAMQQAYYQRSPYNMVRIVLRQPELFDRQDSLYADAARDFAAWRKSGILAQESAPCIFAYSQRFTAPGTETVLERRGFIALGELCDYDRQIVFRHEQTHSGPKADRLSLLRATRANFGQIFMLYSDPGLTAERLLFSSPAMPDMEVTDEYGVLHRVWKVSDPATINLLTTALTDRKLIIADGHHRYETALAYARERAALPVPPPEAEGDESPTEHAPGRLHEPQSPESAAMMTFINMDSDGLVILSAHRVLFGLSDFLPSAFLEKAAAFFEVEPIAGDNLDAAMERLGRLRDRTAFLTVTRAGRFLLTAKPEAVAAALDGISPRQRRLDVVQLHALIFERLLGITQEKIREQAHLRYLRDAAEAADQVVNGEADAAFLMNPVTLDQLREIAFAGEVLPQKSTDFFPKLLSGLAVYALD
ncbi:DUF1015 domain-containing protein [Paracidobacterium acidisoli]|uniref:DUF1015 domain-containing protein n=1 Tax=Paracidobacterium acidisoli TaxID=2303751 RepID=A0A372IKK2_9BACT|nr:DUF1015 domain-containing protein [Paracidobacterium acidisoli]MBT9332767.1 DUF1015 domain-containing protein [Paracidobacterium acidisoli]